MSLQKRGSDYDNELATLIDERTHRSVRAFPMRGSGNVDIPCGDVYISTPSVNHMVEAKKHSWDVGDRRQSLDQDDLQNLWGCYRMDTRVHVVWKFSHLAPMMVRDLDPDVSSDPIDGLGMSVEQKAPDPFKVSYTDSGYVRLTRPPTDEWESARSGVDGADVIINQLGLRVK